MLKSGRPERNLLVFTKATLHIRKLKLVQSEMVLQIGPSFNLFLAWLKFGIVFSSSKIQLPGVIKSHVIDTYQLEGNCMAYR
jgi:hypothetical protein